MGLNHFAGYFPRAGVEREVWAPRISDFIAKHSLQQRLHDLDPCTPVELLTTASLRLVNKPIEMT